MHNFYTFVALALVAAAMAAKLDVATDDQIGSRESDADNGQEINDILVFIREMNENTFSRGKRHVWPIGPTRPLSPSWPFNREKFTQTRRCQYWNGRYICY